MVNDLELKREAFYFAVEQITCLKNYIAGVALNPHQKRVLYHMVISYVKLHLREEGQKEIVVLLTSDTEKTAPSEDEYLNRFCPSVVQVIEQYHLDSTLLSDAEFSLEDMACHYMGVCEPSEKERHSIQATLDQERNNFLTASRAIFKRRYENTDKQNRITCVKNYIENIERHFIVWAESSHLTGLDQKNTWVDLKHFNLSDLDFRGHILQQIDFSASRLDGSCLQATGISASQLAKAIGFTRTIGLPTDLIQQAQTILYNSWGKRIKERMLKLDSLNEEIARLDASLDNQSFSFLRLKKFECLNELQARLKMHASAQKMESQLLEDLTSEQRLSVESMLTITDEKEKSLKLVLSDRLYKVQLLLLPQYLAVLQELVQNKDFSEILNKFNEIYSLLVSVEEADIIKPQYFDEVNRISQLILDLQLDCIRAMFLRALENGEDSEKTLTMVGQALEQFCTIMATISNRMSSPQLIAKMHLIHQDYTRYYVEAKIKAGDCQGAEKRIEEIFGENKKLHYSAENEAPFIHLKHALKLNLIEKYIELGDFSTAQEKMENLLNECKQKIHVLNMAGRTVFANSQFWQGIVFIKNTVCLDSEQIKALSQEQQQQYHELFFETVRTGDLEKVKQDIEKFSWQVNIRNEAGYTAIITACWYGHEDIAKHIFLMGGEIVEIERFEESINPLDALIGDRYKQEPSRYKPIITWLVKNGLELTPDNALALNDSALFISSLKLLEYDIDKKDKLRSLLMRAIDEGADTVVKAIVEHQRECVKSFPKVKHKFFSFLEDNATKKWKELPLLHRACAAGQVQVVNILLLLNEDLITEDSKANRRSALLYLIEVFNQRYPRLGEDFTEFKLLYERWCFIARLLCVEGVQHTLYSWLVLHDDIEEVKRYLNPKNINLPCDAMGNTALHIAIRTRNLILAQWLIKEKATLDVMNSNKELPLYNACYYGDVALVKLLLEAGASVDGPRHLNRGLLGLGKQTPLLQAVSCKKNEVVELLCLHGANIEEKYNNGNTPLHMAIRNQDIKNVQILLRYGANSLALNQQQKSALQAAVAIKNISIIISLVDAYLKQCPDPKKDETIKWIAAELENGEIRQRFYEALIAWEDGFGKESYIQTNSVIQTAPRLAEATTSALITSSSSLFSPIRYRNIASHHEIVHHLSTSFYDEKKEQEVIIFEPIISDGEDQQEELLPPEPSEPISYALSSPRKRG